MFEILAFALMAQAAPAETPAEKSDEDKVVCKSVKVVGSNIRERACLKKSEWELQRDGAKRTLDRRARGGDYRNPTGGS